MASLAIDISGLGPRKSVFIVVVIVGCFSVLWPKIFHPMLMGYTDPQIMPNSMDKSSGCCDVMFTSDVNAVATVAQLCGEVLRQIGFNNTDTISGPRASQICRAEVLSRCGLDISAALLAAHSGPDVKAVKQMMSEMRSVNGSSCLQVEFGVHPWDVGAGHRPRVNAVLDASIHQERPPHLRGDPPHPAMRERGRAIPPVALRQQQTFQQQQQQVEVPQQQQQKQQQQQQQPHVPPPPPQPRVVEGRPAPIPGMRPPLGGAGHMTPAKTSSSPMGVLMPLYTIAIVIFFIYTLMKIVFKKPQDQTIGPYSQVEPDPVFRKRVFGNDSILNDNSSRHRESQKRVGGGVGGGRGNDEQKLVVTAIEGLVADVDRTRAQQQQRDRRPDAKLNVDREDHVHTNGGIGNGSVYKQKTGKSAAPETEQDGGETSHQHQQQHHGKDEKPTVKVLGMEMTARHEGGQRWSRPSTPVLPPHRPPSRVEEVPAPQSIYLEGSLPHQSQLLVSESETHTETLAEQNGTADDPPVVLSGKMTLSVINLDSPEHYEPDDDEDNAEYEDDEELDQEVDLVDELAVGAGEGDDEEDGQDMTDENVNDLEDEDVPVQNSNGIAQDEDINLN